MSDFNVDHEASALFGLTTTSGFYAQNSSEDETSEESVVKGATGNNVCQNIYNSGKDFSNTYGYCGATLDVSLGTIATSFGKVVGTGVAAKVVTGMEISFPGGGQQAEVTISGHSHTTNNHSLSVNPPRLFNVKYLFPSAAGLGVPNIFGATIVGVNCSPSSGSLSFTIEHTDKTNASGAHFVGENMSCRAEASMDFEGVCGAASDIASIWSQGLRSLNDSNDDLDTSSMTAHAFVDHTV